MNISSLNRKISDLKKQLDAVNQAMPVEVRHITVKPGQQLPEGTTEDDYDYVVYLSSEEFPRTPGAHGWTSA